MEKNTIYIDLDGVLADFDRHYEQLFGPKPVNNESLMWKNIVAYGNFFGDAPFMPQAEELFEHIDSYDSHNKVILTACPKSDYANSAKQKKKWVREHFGDHIRVLPVMGGANKYLFMHEQNDILIDDYEKNILPWTASGGIGIWHKTHDETIEQLRSVITNHD